MTEPERAAPGGAGLLAGAERLLRQGRYPELDEALLRPGPADEGAAAAVLRIRGLLARGRVGDAAAAGLAALRDDPRGEDAARLRLWVRMVALYGPDPAGPAAPDPAAELERECAGLLAAAGTPPALRALARDFLARARLFRDALDGDPPARRAGSAAELGEVAAVYAAAGDAAGELEALRRQAGLLRHPLGGDRARARLLYRTAADRAAAAGDEVGAAEAGLAAAEMELEDCLDHEPDGCRPEATLPAFEEAERRFAAGGHAFGAALVRWSVARILVLYGREAGIPLAHEAVGAFSAAGALALERDVWSDLYTWHTRRGEPREAAHALREGRRVAAGIGSAVATGVEWLAHADQAFRAGHAAEARRVLAAEVERLPSVVQRASCRIILSNTAGSVGLEAEARRLVEEAVAELEAQEPTPLLGEALLVLATRLAGEDPDAAIACAGRAVQVAQRLGARLEEGKYLAFRAWQKVLRARARGGHAGVPDEAATDFDRAEALLGRALTLEGRVELVTLYEHRGQAGLVFHDWEACGEWLTRAEQVARSYGLVHTLAFILVNQGLVLVQLARSGGLAKYDAASGLLDEALELFDRSGLRALRWRTLFYRALCDVEGGRWEDPGSPARGGRWDRARELLEEAAREIDRLRGFADDGPGARRQTVAMSFAEDKQKLFEVGFDLAWSHRRDAADALRWLERMKARALLDALAGTALPRGTLADHPLLVREQELLARKRGAGDALEAVAIQDELDRLLGEMAADAATAGYAALRDVVPPTWVELREILRREDRRLDGRRLLVAQYAVVPGGTLLFGMRGDWEAPRVERLALDGKLLEDFARTHFRTPGGVRMLMDDLADAGERAWGAFGTLVAPLAGWTDPDDVVCLVPHGVLHDLPLHTLPVDGRALALRNPVFYAPSTSLLRHTLGRGAEPGPGSGGVAVFGDSCGDLPRSRAEAVAVARRLGGRAWLGADVTRERVAEALASSRLVHFAGHGDLSSTDGFASGLHLAGGSVLRAVEMLSARVASDLVVLSGCETGVSERRPGDELAGLVGALLASGAGALLVSQWRVHDASTEALLCAFHEESGAGLPRAEALRRALRRVRATPGWEHFYHWGGFVLVGNWR